MAYRYEFLEVAARVLFRLTRHIQPLLHQIVATHIPAILQDPCKAGEPRKADLAHARACGLKVKGVAYRLIYEVDGEVVRFIAIGPRGAAYERARRR